MPDGATLRSYLAEKLNCDPMRITKKFTGDLAIGKRVFALRGVTAATNYLALPRPSSAGLGLESPLPCTIVLRNVSAEILAAGGAGSKWRSCRHRCSHALQLP